TNTLSRQKPESNLNSNNQTQVLNLEKDQNSFNGCNYGIYYRQIPYFIKTFTLSNGYVLMSIAEMNGYQTWILNNNTAQVDYYGYLQLNGIKFYIFSQLTPSFYKQGTMIASEFSDIDKHNQYDIFFVTAQPYYINVIQVIIGDTFQFETLLSMTEYQCLNSVYGQLYNDGQTIYLIAVCEDFQIISFNTVTGKTQKIIKINSIPNHINSFEEIQLIGFGDNEKAQDDNLYGLGTKESPFTSSQRLINSETQSTTAIQIINPLGSVFLNEIKFNNSNSDSVYNYIYIQSDIAIIQNCTFSKSSYDVSNQKAIFKQQGGCARVKSNNLQILNSQFSQSTSYSGSFVQVDPLSQILKISVNQSSFSEGYSQSDGSCLYVNSQNTKLDFQILNSNFTDIFSFSQDSYTISIQSDQISLISSGNLLISSVIAQNILGMNNNSFINMINSNATIQNLQVSQMQTSKFTNQFDISKNLKDFFSNAIIYTQNSNVSFIQCNFTNLSGNQNSMNPLLIQSSSSLIRLQNSYTFGCIFTQSLINMKYGELIIQNTTFQNIIQIQNQNRIIQSNQQENQKQSSSLIIMSNSSLKIIQNTLFQSIKCLNNCYGSSIYLSYTSFNISNTQFINSQSSFGGAISIYGMNQSDNFLIQSYFNNNNATYNGGAINLNFYQNDVFQMQITETQFLNNKALTGNGGAIYISSQGVNSTQQKILIAQSQIRNNQAMMGGGIYSQGINPQLDSLSSVSHNQASYNGDNQYSYPSELYLTNQNTFNHSFNQEKQIIVLNDFKSGGVLPNFEFQLRDQNQKPYVLFNNEIISAYFQISSLTKQKEFYSIRGNQIVNMDYKTNLFDFDGLTLVGIPNSISFYEFKSDSIHIFNNQTQVYDLDYSYLIQVNFRNCQHGEIIKKYSNFLECQTCELGKFSLDFTGCYPCPNGGSCANGKISLQQGYWREKEDSEEIIFCVNRPENCVGESYGDLVCQDSKQISKESDGVINWMNLNSNMTQTQSPQIQIQSPKQECLSVTDSVFTDYTVSQMEFVEELNKILISNQFQLLLAEPYTLQASKVIYLEEFNLLNRIKNTNYAVIVQKKCQNFIIDIFTLSVVSSFNGCYHGVDNKLIPSFLKTFTLLNGQVFISILEKSGFQTWLLNLNTQIAAFQGYLQFNGTVYNGQYADIDKHDNYDILFVAASPYYINVIQIIKGNTLQYQTLQSINYLSTGFTQVYQVVYNQTNYFVTAQSTTFKVAKDTIGGPRIIDFSLPSYVKTYVNSFIQVKNCNYCFVTLIDDQIIHYQEIFQSTRYSWIGLWYYFGLNLQQISSYVEAYHEDQTDSVWVIFGLPLKIQKQQYLFQFFDIKYWIFKSLSSGNPTDDANKTCYALYSHPNKKIVGLDVFAEYKCLFSIYGQLYNNGETIYLLAVCGDFQIISFNIVTGKTQKVYQLKSVPNHINSFEEIQLIGFGDNESGHVYLYKFNKITGLFEFFIYFTSNKFNEESLNLTYMPETQSIWIQYRQHNTYFPIGYCLQNLESCLSCQMDFYFSTTEKQQSDNLYGLGTIDSPFTSSKSLIELFHKASNINSQDNSIISIINQDINKYSLINFTSVEVYSSAFIQSLTNTYSNPIFILSPSNSQINIQKSSFQYNNLMGLVNSETQSTTAIQIINPLGSVFLNDTFFQNSNSNSKYNYLYVQSDVAEIQNCTFLKSSYDISNQNAIFKQQGGCARIKSNNLRIINSQFLQSTSYTGTFLYIDPLSQTLSMLVNCSSFSQGYSQSDGSAFFINSLNTNFDIQILSSNFSDIYSYSEDSNTIFIQSDEISQISQGNLFISQVVIQNILGMNNNSFVNIINSNANIQNLNASQTQISKFTSQFDNTKTLKDFSFVSIVNTQNSNVKLNKCNFMNLAGVQKSKSPLLIQSANSFIKLLNTQTFGCIFTQSLINMQFGELEIQNSTFSNIVQISDKNRFIQKSLQANQDQQISLIVMTNSSLTINQDTIFDSIKCLNSCYGSSIYLSYTSFNISNTRFTNSQASFGGAISIFGMTQNNNTLSQSYFQNNNASKSGGAIYLNLYQNDECQFQINSTVVINNKALTGYGGAFYISSLGKNSSLQKILIAQSSVISNQAMIGGGVYNQGINPQLDSLTSISNNQASYNGNNQYSYPSELYLTNQNSLNHSFNQEKQIIVLNDFKSGGILPCFEFQLRDQSQKPYILFNSEIIEAYFQISNLTQFLVKAGQKATPDKVNMNVPCVKIQNQMLTNYFQIISAASTFNLGSQIGFMQVLSFFGQPIQTQIDYLDCVLKNYNRQIPLIYFKLVFSVFSFVAILVLYTIKESQVLNLQKCQKQVSKHSSPLIDQNNFNTNMVQTSSPNQAPLSSKQDTFSLIESVFSIQSINSLKQTSTINQDPKKFKIKLQQENKNE
ncbi:hypothetical protein ABPG73_004591, partial [Tetrahymena malaccensis]